MTGRRGSQGGREQERAFGKPVRKRLATYHQIAAQAAESGLSHLASAQLAEMLDVDDSLVRKDMAHAGIAGRPKVGYALADVLRRLEELLGLSARNDAILIGCGHLGAAILGYPGFATYGLKITAAFDRDFTKVGQEIAGHRVLPMEKCRSILEIFRVRIAILTVPAGSAQELTDWLVSRGVRGIWNFAPTQLTVPAGVVVRHENLAVGLARLIHSLKEETDRHPAPAPGAVAAAPRT
ncbi:MAG TPA: redox-sensing transcriptional repressor Rex [Polyangia bacterium]|jgi:redox-sensing transcriptional repressor